MKYNKNLQNKVDNLINRDIETSEFLDVAHLQIEENNRIRKVKPYVMEKSTGGVTGTGTETAERHVNSNILITTIACAFALIVSMVAILWFMLKDNDIVYTFSGDMRVSSIEEINNDSDIQFNDIDGCTVYCAYDTEYNVKLFYTISYNDGENYDTLEIIVKINTDFDYMSLETETYLSSVAIKNYILNYNESLEFIDDELYESSISGLIEHDDEIVYVNYSGIRYDGESNFVSLLEAFIK